MGRKICNNKVEFSANGKYVVFELSDKELKTLRVYDDERKHSNFGWLYNFSAFAFFDYEVKGSKCGRFRKNFNYHNFEKMMWRLIEDEKLNEC
jgi:hypothetical protein